MKSAVGEDNFMDKSQELAGLKKELSLIESVTMD